MIYCGMQLGKGVTQTSWTQKLHMGFVWGFDSCGQAALTTEYFPCEIQSLFLELVDREKLPKKLAQLLIKSLVASALKMTRHFYTNSSVKSIKEIIKMECDKMITAEPPDWRGG